MVDWFCKVIFKTVLFYDMDEPSYMYGLDIKCLAI